MIGTIVQYKDPLDLSLVAAMITAYKQTIVNGTIIIEAKLTLFPPEKTPKALHGWRKMTFCTSVERIPSAGEWTKVQ